MFSFLVDAASLQAAFFLVQKKQKRQCVFGAASSALSLLPSTVLAENSCVAKEWEQKKEKVPLLLVESAFL